MLTSLEEIQKQGLEALGIFISIYPGVVIENEDPEKLFRLKIQVPSLFGKQTLENWALPCGLNVVSDGGQLQLPAQGDNVWVMFQQGDMEAPVWIFGAMPQGKKTSIGDKKHSLWQNQVNTNIALTDVVELNGNSQEALLGNDTVALIKDLITAIKNLKVVCGPAGSPSTFLVNLAEFVALEPKIDKILSKKVKLS